MNDKIIQTMGTPQETDERLRSWLDSNQLARERLCLAVLSLDKRFTNVRSRHPRGGPDHGRDMEATFRDGRRVFAAVGFVNSASDSPSEKTAIKKKFRDDLAAALGADPDLKVFVFFTNVALTVGEKKELEDSANERGLAVVDIFDRERMRIALDSTDGFAVRFQYLAIHLSDAEQAAFFAKWGDDLEQLITKSVGAVDSKLERIQFIQEQALPLHSISFHFRLKRELSTSEIPHLRALMAIKFAPLTNRPEGRLHMLVCNDHGEWAEEKAALMKGYVGEVAYIWARDPTFLLKRDLYFQNERFKSACSQFYASGFGPPILGKTLGNLDHGLVSFFANETLAREVSEITVIANQYIIWKTSSPEIQQGDPEGDFPVTFTPSELKNPWFKLTGDLTSGWFDFSRFTPRRMFSAEEIPSAF